MSMNRRAYSKRRAYKRFLQVFSYPTRIEKLPELGFMRAYVVYARLQRFMRAMEPLPENLAFWPRGIALAVLTATFLVPRTPQKQ